jgi:hypothetical protein
MTINPSGDVSLAANRVSTRGRGRECKMHPKRIEAVGIAFILTAALWEAHVLRAGYLVYFETPFSAINQKIDHIWWALGKPMASEYVRDHLREFTELVGDPSLRKARSVFMQGPENLVRSGLFLLGSLLVVVGKWRDGKPPK